MRLKQHILEVNSPYDIPTRSKELGIEEGFAKIQKECKSALRSYMLGNAIYRGSKSVYPVSFIQPSKHVRVSANTINLYTLILDNSKKWSNYPKRSESVVCSNDLGVAGMYTGLRSKHDANVVFPKDGFKLGVCPGRDIWTSFKLGLLVELNDRFTDFVRGLDIDFKYKTMVLRSYSELVELCGVVDRYVADHEDDMVSSFLSTYRYAAYDGDLMLMLEELLDPVRNKFKTVINIDSIGSGSHEVWTDSDCYLVKMDVLKELL
jgi:hypothetical protein